MTNNNMINFSTRILFPIIVAIIVGILSNYIFSYILANSIDDRPIEFMNDLDHKGGGISGGDTWVYFKFPRTLKKGEEKSIIIEVCFEKERNVKISAQLNTSALKITPSTDWIEVSPKKREERRVEYVDDYNEPVVFTSSCTNGAKWKWGAFAEQAASSLIQVSFSESVFSDSYIEATTKPNEIWRTGIPEKSLEFISSDSIEIRVPIYTELGLTNSQSKFITTIGAFLGLVFAFLAIPQLDRIQNRLKKHNKSINSD